MDKALAANNARTTADRRTPTLIADKYRVVRVLGEGASGTVFLCEHTALEKQVAVKVLHRELTDNADLVARFKHEAQTAARLDHPNSVHVMDFGQDREGTLYLAMEYVEGRDLAELLEDNLALDDERIVHIMSCVLSALSAAHALGIVHRDLKPENILFRYADDETPGTDIVKVCDFGVAQFSPMRIARGNKRDTPTTHRMTEEGMIIGTPWYMSPEQARAEALDARSDIYSAGVVLFQLLTRTLPFLGDDPMAVAVMHCTTPPPPPSGYGPVHPELEAVCLRALSKTREARYQSALEMLAALQAAAAIKVASRSLARGSRPSGDKLALLPVPAHAANAMTELAAPAVRPPSGLRRIKPSLVVAGLALSSLAAAAVPHLLPQSSGAGVTTVSAATAADSEASGDEQPLAPPGEPAHADPAAVAAQEPAVAIEDDPELALHQQATQQGEVPEGVSAPAEHATGTAEPASQPTVQASAPKPTARRSSERRTAQPADARRTSKPAVASAADSTASDEPPAQQAQDRRPAATAAGAEPPEQTSKLAEADAASALAAALAGADPAPAAAPTEAAAVKPAHEPRSEPPATSYSPPKPVAAPPIARVAIVAEKLPSGISRSSLRSAFNQSSLTHCYQQAQQRAPNAPLPNAAITISTNMSGRIVSARVDDGVPFGLRECLEQVARTGRIRNGDGGEVHTTVEVEPQS